jgi:ribosome biogenesis GTPase
MSLHHLGWNAHFENLFVPHRNRGLEPARVSREDRGRYGVLDERGARSAELAGRLRHEARTRAELPAVGDWVALRPGAASSGVIDAVLPRASAFTRKLAGETTEEQVIAANVDVVFLVSGLDADFNPRRIERYLAAAWESGAEPVVVLNKADLSQDLESRLAEVAAVAPGAAVVPLSALGGQGLESLEPWLLPGRTVALLGSSGVGKSTLVNALLGQARQETGSVREEDSRGRHTTTHRELVPLPGGAVLLDTPGMRELQLWGDESGLDGAFPEITELAQQCRFRDCGHEGEPGCAVLGAVDDGTLGADRLESWRKLQRELRWLASRQDARARAEQLAKWKAIHKSMRGHPKSQRRN